MNAPPPDVDPTTKTARDLTEILNLIGAIPDEATHRAGARIDGTGLPGGLAMVTLGPVANHEAWENQYQGYEHANKTHTNRPPVDLSHIEDEDDTWEPPLQTIRYWSDQYRRTHQAEWDHIPTINTEASFLRHILNWIWENNPEWEHFAADINRARRRLEDLVHAGTRVERSRVPCTAGACETQPRLIRVYGATVADDHYKCPHCKTRYTPSQFARAKLQHLESEGADRHVKMQDARDAIDRPTRTWSKWLRYGYVRSYRDPNTGQTWVWWPDVRQVDLDTPRRRRSA